MTDSWTEQAAARAVELAEELILGEGTDTAVRATRAAQHLTYMAGLLRGGAPMEEVITVEGEAWIERRARLRAERQRDELADELKHSRKSLARTVVQLGELLAAARKVLATTFAGGESPTGPAANLRRIVARLEKA